MTTINKILTFIFLIALSSCTTEEPENNVIAVDPNPVEEEPAPVNPVMITYLTVNVDANYNTNTIPSEDWILVHKENGDLFNYVPLQNGGNIILEALDTVNLANMTVTKLRVNDFGNKLSYNIQSYGKLQPGRVLSLTGFTSNAPLTDLGQVDINVSNVPLWNSYTLTNTQDHSPTELSAYMAYNPGFDANTIDITNFAYKQSNDYLMTVIDSNWNPSYHWINGLTNGASITLDGSTQFSAFDQVVTVPVNSSINNFSSNVSAMNAITNSRFNLYWSSTANPNYVAGTSSSFGIGYLNAYQDYETNISMGNDNYNYSFRKKGSQVTTGEVVFPTESVTITDNSFANYNYSTNVNHVVNTSRWGGGTQTDTYKIDWVIYGPNSDIPSINEMPLVDFPDLDFANVSFISAKLITEGDAYTNYTGRIFGDATITTFNPIEAWFSFQP